MSPRKTLTPEPLAEPSPVPRHTTPVKDDADPQAPDSSRWLILLAVGIGSFMSALDGSVVNTILPVVRAVFASDIATIEWAVTLYLLVVSGLLLTFGRLGDLRGHKPVYVWGFVVFGLGSALCGAAPSATALIAFRGLQAFGAAMLLSNAPALLTRNFPAAQRGRVLGLQSTMTYLGLTIGPSLGGWLADRIDWRAVFYINVPVGLLALTLSLRFIPRDGPAERAERFDFAGAALFLAGLVALLLAMNQGHAWGWTSAPVLGLFAAAAALLAAFVAVESRIPAPVLDLSLFRQRLFSAAAASALLNYVCVYSITFLMPFYLIQGRGLRPSQAGLLLSVQPLVMSIAAPLSGTLSDRIGSRAPATAGMGVLAAGLLLLSRLGPDSALWLAAAGLAVAGLGIGMFVSPNSSALMGSAPRRQQGIASGVTATARNLGMVLGVGLAGAILTTGSAAGSLFDAVRAGMLAAAVVAIASMATAAVRGNGQRA